MLQGHLSLSLFLATLKLGGRLLADRDGDDFLQKELRSSDFIRGKFLRHCPKEDRHPWNAPCAIGDARTINLMVIVER
jgi:hypothetical protein